MLATLVAPQQIPPDPVLLFAAEAGLSRAWLARYRFGPLEWGWRVLTYARLQPLRRVVAPVARGT